MRAATFAGGGCLDGATAGTVLGGVFECHGSGSWYALDGGTLVFAGHGTNGEAMAQVMQQFNDDRNREALEAAARPRGCGRCGRTFANSAAYSVHFESGEGSRCLPDDAFGQLEVRDGVWMLAGTGR